MNFVETVAWFGMELGCYVCPSESDMNRYFGWECMLHEIGHFAIAPRFLWDKPAHLDAVQRNERPPVPPVNAYSYGVGHDGEISNGFWVWDDDGKMNRMIAAIIENPLPLTDWHVRAWTVWATDLLGLPTPSKLWLQTSPWLDLASDATFRDRIPGIRPGWAERHAEQVEIWEQRAAANASPDQEMEWRLDDLAKANVLTTEPAPFAGQTDLVKTLSQLSPAWELHSPEDDDSI